MKQRIHPSIMAKSQKELDGLFAKLQGVASFVHLDVADGQFVPNDSLWFNLGLSSKFRYSAHLMVKDSAKWVEVYGRRVDVIIFHPEGLRKGSVRNIIKKIKLLKKGVGLALKPETTVADVKDYLGLVDYVLVLTVHPGFYGAEFLQFPLKKIKQIKKINSKIEVVVDGGMNLETIKEAKRAGGDLFVSGSYVSKAKDVKKAYGRLERIVG